MMIALYVVLFLWLGIGAVLAEVMFEQRLKTGTLTFRQLWRLALVVVWWPVIVSDERNDG